MRAALKEAGRPYQGKSDRALRAAHAELVQSIAEEAVAPAATQAPGGTGKGKKKKSAAAADQNAAKAAEKKAEKEGAKEKAAAEKETVDRDAAKATKATNERAGGAAAEARPPTRAQSERGTGPETGAAAEARPSARAQNERGAGPETTIAPSAAADVHAVGGGRAAGNKPTGRILFGCTGVPRYQDGSKAREQLRRPERLVPQWAAELAVPLCTDKTKPASERIFGGDAESGERLYRSLVEPAVGLLEWCAVLRAL